MSESELPSDIECLDRDCYKKAWEHFKYIREEIKHEYNLLQGRVTWYITCQSFLITGYVISCDKSESTNFLSNHFLPILALFITIPAIFMIQAALTTIKMWNELQQDLIKKHSNLDPLIIERWRSDKLLENDLISRNALLFPCSIPMIFGIFWVITFFVSWKIY